MVYFYGKIHHIMYKTINERYFMKLILLTLLLLCNAFSTLAYPMHANVSAYTHTGNTMANGQYPYESAIAMDDVPLGTQVIINGRTYVVADRFGGGYTNRIDIFMDTYEQAINFGRQYLTVEVIK